MPFAGYTDFAECVRQNQQADDPNAYCGSIKHKVEDKMQKAIDSASHLRQAVQAAVSVVVKGHDPVKEVGKKKLTAKDGVANEGAQDDQAFAVAFGPDNYDKLTKTLIAAPYQEAYNAAGTILKALENKQFNFPGNIEEHMKKAHAAIHGREMWDARYGDVCDLITQARKILHSIEKTAEVSQGGSGMMVVGKADPGQSEKPKQRTPAVQTYSQSQPVKVGGKEYYGQKSPGSVRPRLRARPQPQRPAQKAASIHPSEPSHSASWMKHRGKPPARKAVGDYKFAPGKPPARPQPKAGVGNLPRSGFPHRGYAHKAVRRALKAVYRR